MKVVGKLVIAFILVLLFFQVKTVLAETRLNVYLFYGDGCSHCRAAEEALVEVQKKYPELNFNQFEVYHNKDNSSLFKKVAKKLNMSVNGVPFFVVGDKGFIGYKEGDTISKIEKQIDLCLSSGCSDEVASIVGVDASHLDNQKTSSVTNISKSEETHYSLVEILASFFIV